MFRIRRIYDQTVPVNREAVAQVQAMLADRFSGLPAADVESLGEHLRNPFKRRFRTVLFVAEDPQRRVQGFALVLHEPELGFLYLDFLASDQALSGRGIGASLYERVREEAAALGARGVFLECLPDDPALCPDPELARENAARLRFYERFGARPLAGTAYETPVRPGGTCPPYLVYDGVNGEGPSRDWTRRVVQAILERKYGDLCPPQYVEKVVASIGDDPVRLRELAYVKPRSVKNAVTPAAGEPIPLVVNDRHQIHHVRERGYVEAPVRIASILAELEPTGLFARRPPKEMPLRHVTAVHDPELVRYLRRTCEEMPEGKSLYPYVFPVRNQTRLPADRSVLAGYYCIDTFTPIHRNAFPAARRAVDCALTAADEILDGRRLAYALVRPPGHHAEHRAFGGFCYFNNAAVAAHYLSAHGRVALLDVDYHHGNGQQDIFYRRADVLTVSIHGHPRFAYPYFSGFADERGEGEGEGFNLNLPLPEARDGGQYLKTLDKALAAVAAFEPAFLVVALGLDPAKGDPTGTWSLQGRDFRANGEVIGALRLPTLVVQEGGYRTRTLGVNARHFFTGLAARVWQ